MTKGRNAAAAFKNTRTARFADARREAAELKAAEVAAGVRRDLLVVEVLNVRDDDEVALAAGGFALAGETERALWGESNGRTFVRRFRTPAN